MCEISQLCKSSAFIDKLIANGYEPTEQLSVLLTNLELHYHQINDIILLLTIPTNYFPKLLMRIGINESITIYDELCMPVHVSKITCSRIINTTMNKCIINHDGGQRILTNWANGYGILTNWRVYWSQLSELWTSAIQNGLYFTECNLGTVISREEQLSLQHLPHPILRDAMNDILVLILSPKEKTYNVPIIPTSDDLSLFSNVIGLCVINVDTLPEHLPFSKTLIRVSVKRTIHSESPVNYAMLQQCTNLQYLDADNNPATISCEPFAKTLRTLYAGNSCGIGDHEIASCRRLASLSASNNIKITTCKPFANSLIKLWINKSAGMTNEGIASCTRLKILHANRNQNITTCEPFANTLRILYINNESKICDDGLKMCTRIKVLSVLDNPNITTCAPFANFLKKLYMNKGSSIGYGELNKCAKLDKKCMP